MCIILHNIVSTVVGHQVSYTSSQEPWRKMEAFFVIPKAQSTTDVDALFDHEANFCSKLNGMIIIIAVFFRPLFNL